MKGDVHLPHPGEGRTRWCSGCAGLHVGAVDTRGKKFTDANSNVDQLGASGSSPASGSSLPHPPAVDPPPTPPGPPRSRGCLSTSASAVCILRTHAKKTGARAQFRTVYRLLCPVLLNALARVRPPAAEGVEVCLRRRRLPGCRLTGEYSFPLLLLLLLLPLLLLLLCGRLALRGGRSAGPAFPFFRSVASPEAGRKTHDKQT